LPLQAHGTIGEADTADIVILPSLLLHSGRWQTGRYPRLVAWLQQQHEAGAILCSACSGVMVLAETGLLDGGEATLHWAYGRAFAENFPRVKLRLEDVLVVGGPDGRLVMSGASAFWHDLLLYLICRFKGAEAAQTIAKFFLLQRHSDGQAPYIMFQEIDDHGDAVILEAQRWLRSNVASATAVEHVVKSSSLPERSFQRRFRKATGYSTLAYLQHLRVEAAKRELERTSTAVDEISYKVGYEEPAFFRRLFKRTTGLTPAAYRRKFTLRLGAISDGARTGPSSLNESLWQR
jgi:transcriptional regulator GlxA family with amidase domain